MRRGLVVDSVRTARERSRYSVVVFGFISTLLERAGVPVMVERTA
jgi:hypothetical protein